MKLHRTNYLARFTGMSLAVALLTGVAGLMAQDGAKGGATKLLQVNGNLMTATARPSRVEPMACGKCTDSLIAARDNGAKGGARGLFLTGTGGTQLITRHGCTGCTTDWKVVGHGKTKVAVASHACANCGIAHR